MCTLVFHVFTIKIDQGVDTAKTSEPWTSHENLQAVHIFNFGIFESCFFCHRTWGDTRKAPAIPEEAHFV